MYTKNNPTTAVDGKPAHCPSCGSYCDVNKDLDENDYCNDCRPKNKKETLDEILSKFENGEHRYYLNPDFRVHIEALVLGIGVYAVLDSVLKANKTLQDLNSEYLHRLNNAQLRLLKYENPQP